MTKKEALRNDLEKAKDKLKKAANLPETEINQDATIQRFEFTFELSWKLMQELARESKPDTYGPRNSIREVARLGLVEDISQWFEFLDARNLSVHTYNEETAKKVYAQAKKFPELVGLFLKNLAES